MTAEMTTIPVGVKNFNPLNLRPVQPPFEGTTGSMNAGASGAFITFQSNVFGFRAAARNMIQYSDRLGINTVQGVIERWAPSNENDTRAYIVAVCNKTGFASDQKIDLHAYADVYNLLHAMTEVEQGAPFETYFKRWELDEGLRRAGIADVPPTPLHKRLTAIGGAVAAGSTTAAVVAPVIQQAAQSLQPIAGDAVHVPWISWPLAVLGILGGALSIYGSFSLAKRQGV